MPRIPNLTVLAVAATLTATAAAQGWTQRSSLFTPPARNNTAAAYDVNRGVMTVFGGQGTGLVTRGDTWEWNGIAWGQRITPVQPAARWGHSMAFDARRGRVSLFGGYDGTAMRSDTWDWDGFSWQARAAATQPPARAFAGMAYDSLRGVAVMFGGQDANQAGLADTWEWDGTTWTQRSSANAPSPRWRHAMAFDDVRYETLLFGGGDGTAVSNELWAWNGSTWTLKATPTAPSPRWDVAMAFDSACGNAVVFGGADATWANNAADAWQWDGASWTQLAGTTPPARHSATLAHDAQRGQFVAFGGRDATAFRNDTWELATACSRTMSVVTAPQVGSTAAFRFDYPGAAAGHFYFHLLAGHQPGSFSVPIPGITSIGVSRVDLFNIYLQPSGLLDASGSNLLNVGIPPDNFLAGLPFDVQTVDFNFFTNTLYWANNDAEVSIAPVIPPVASFTATPAFGQLPLVVQFTDTSTNAPTSWQWDFDNDGTVDSTQQNPSCTYTSTGLYSVRLVAANLAGSSASLRSNLINAGPLVPNPLLNMVAVAAGTFQMGSIAGPANEQPVHAVTITRPFWVGKYEVTQAEYQAVMGSNPSNWRAAQRPVEQVSWNNAMSYCSTLTATEAAAGRIPAGYQYRLPTEAEWEYVCRGGTTTEWSTGASIVCGQANISGCGPFQTTVVGIHVANPWGLFDTHGNLWEWCLDSWDGSANYPSAAVSDPYVTSGPNRVYRGGSFSYPAAICRSAYRWGLTPGFTNNAVGFRVVLAPVLVP